jgi:acetate---CoA ligase (ADP-forming)
VLERLRPLFSPSSVAVVGASRREGTIGNEIFRNLLRCGFTGAVYPVHPTARSVAGVRAWPSLAALPEPAELVVVVVPSDRVLAVAQECADNQVQAIVVITAGFREIGGLGAERERALVQLVRDAGIRLVGPNCLGVINTAPEVRLNATFAPAWPHHGRVGFLSQSGALGVAILDHSQRLGIGVSSFVSVGNRADVSANDLLEYWEEDPETDIILLYLESFGNPRRFTRIARRVSEKMPVIAVKSGRSAAGQRAASSHTGSLTGADAAADALFRQTGVIRVDTLEELFNTCMLLANQPVPRGNRVAILTNAGGPGILATDACEAHGLALTGLSPHTEAALKALLPPEASVHNPVDMIASATPEMYRRALQLVLEDELIDSVLVIYVPPIVTHPTEVADAIRQAAAGATKPVICNFLGTHGIPESLRSLKAGSIPSYAFPETAAISLARATRYGQWRAQPKGQERIFDDVRAGEVEQILAAARARGGEGWLTPTENDRVLAAYGIPAARSAEARTPREAAAIAETLGFPVAVKLVSESITHKSDVKGVRLGLRTTDDVFDACAGMRGRLDALGIGDQMDGVLVQEMVSEGLEMIVGGVVDPALGPMVMVGLGGVNVELLDDVAVRVYPLRDTDAAEMLASLRGAPLLRGYRDSPPVDIPALEEILLRISQLLGNHPELAELDINPLKALPPGRGAVAVDARIRVDVGVTE